MREAAEPAVPAVRSIALMVWRVDIACKTLVSSAVSMAEPGKARPNRMNAPLLADRQRRNQGAKR